MRVQKSIASVSHEAAPERIIQPALARIRKFIKSIWLDVALLIVIGIIFVVPFVFILLTAAKPRAEAALFQFSWPSRFQLLENLRDVMTFGNNRMWLALYNSIALTIGSVALIVIFSALAAFVLQRRQVEWPQSSVRSCWRD